MNRNVLNPSLALGTKKNPISKAKTETIAAPMRYGRKKRVKEIPELNMAITSVLLANLEVNQMIEENGELVVEV